MTAEHAPPPLGHAVGSALRWSALAQLLGRVVGFGVGVMLARLLTTEDFGEYAVALVAVNVLIVANDLGIIGTVVRWQGDERRIAPTAASLCLASTAVIYAGVFVAAPAFASALGAPDATNLVRAVATVILVDGLTAVPQAVLVRTFRNDLLVRAEFLGFGIGTPITIAMAVAGAGPWSIVVGRVVSAAVVGIVVFFKAPYRVRPGFDRPTASALLRFGAPLSMSAVIAQCAMNVDYVIVGRILGKTDLGVYLLAFNVSSLPVSIVTTAIGRVALAGFSRMVEDRERLVAAFSRAIGAALSGLMPLVVILGVLGREVITFVYGAKWLGAVTPLRFLVVLGGLRILIDLFIDLAIADNRPNSALVVRAAWLALLVPALAIGADAGGLGGVGVAHLAVAGVVIMPWLVAGSRRSGIRLAELSRYARRPLAASVAGGAAMLAIMPLLSGTFARLAVAGAAGTAVYLAVLLPGNPLVPWMLSRLRPVRTAPG